MLFNKRERQDQAPRNAYFEYAFKFEQTSGFSMKFELLNERTDRLLPAEFSG